MTLMSWQPRQRAVTLVASHMHRFGSMSKRTTPGNAHTAIGYIRVSKDAQKLGPDAQRASIEAWAAHEGVSVVGWYVDAGVCSVTPMAERPALCAALAGLRAHGAGVLVVAK